MTFNKIPLAIGYDPATGNASGLVEFILNLSDVGDVCSDTVPTTNQVLAWTGSEACWSSIVFPAGGGGSFDCSSLSACNLSSLGDVCSATPLVGQVLAYSGANGFCYSSINFPASAEPLVSSVNGATGDVILELDDINAATNTSFAANGTLTVAGASKFTVAGNSGDVTVGNVTIIRGADGDIEAGKDVVIGQNSFTQTNAKIANVEENSLVITDPTSSVSSVSGASGTIPYFTGATPKPVLTGIPTIMQESRVRVEDKVLKDISDVAYTTAENGSTLVRAGGNWKALNPPQYFNVKGQGGNDLDGDSLGAAAAIDHGLALSGLGDDDHPQYVLSGGSRAMSALTVTNSITANSLSATTIDFDPEGSLAINATTVKGVNVSGTTSVSSNNILGTSGSIASTPTENTNIANKSYVDGINNTQHNRLFAVGTKTDSIANTTVYLGWEFDTVSALSVSDSGGVITIGGTGNTEVTFGEAGDYMIDCTVRANADNRIELFCRAEYQDATQDTPGFVSYNRLQNSNYAARDTDQNTGGTTLSLLLSLNANDKLRFEAEADADGTAVLLINGTFLRIVKLA